LVEILGAVVLKIEVTLLLNLQDFILLQYWILKKQIPDEAATPFRCK